MWNKKLPVFRLSSDQNLTKEVLNKKIKGLLEDSRFRGLKISARSFRAGIPTDLEHHPEFAHDKHVKIWGRWLSSAYKRYMKAGLDKKRWIFEKKICRAVFGKTYREK